MKGILSSVLEETVNFINSLDLAKERGINIEEIKSSQKSDYVNSIGLFLKSDEEELFMEGTLFADQHPRIVRINDFYVEVAPSDYMVFVSNKDKPGIIGRLGSILGKHNINIASMNFGRKEKGGEALTVLTVDNPLSSEVIEEVLKDENFASLKFIKI